jgi:hypothetical protein
MQPGMPDELRNRVSDLRAGTLEVLDEMSRRGLERDADLYWMVSDLLGAANTLGKIETALTELSPRPVPADAATMPLSQDAAIVLTLAGTSLPFATSVEAEAERWLRVLRLHGEVGSALQSLGIPEAPLETAAEPHAARSGGASRAGEERVTQVGAEAADFARRRSAPCVGTSDILFAVLSVYDKAFDRALYVRGATREELIERLAAGVAADRQ